MNEADIDSDQTGGRPRPACRARDGRPRPKRLRADPEGDRREAGLFASCASVPLREGIDAYREEAEQAIAAWLGGSTDRIEAGAG